ncbi:MAG TPA: DNA gyrase inhibitor YacG [Candidatus Brocadiia bacterium]|nr:DNA gyrase inhibitor YacG [Candidatus Brocadiia bacterium]
MPSLQKIECRTCRKPLKFRKIDDLPFFPFCSERCRLLDLGDWLDEKHVISDEISQPGEDADGLTRGEES